ncbi:MAG: diheme cytochrome c-553 [Gemmatimonadaceae bacterium]|nr:diheme cytochrome c-553 [Chitinophagaceae bacterium]
MKKILSIVSASVAILAIVVSCNDNVASTFPAPVSNDSLIRKGKYLVSVLGCEDCHSPKVFGPMGPMPDPEKRLAGHPAEMPVGEVDTTLMKSWVYFNHIGTAVAGPWGISYAANLSSDSTGIGNWSYQQFEMALRKGKSKGIESNRSLLPPMPWPNYINMKDEDMRAVFTYLKSTKPVKNQVPQPTPATGFRVK